MGRAPVPKPPEVPGWLRWLIDHLKPVGRFFEWITSLMPAAPLAQILLWSVIVIALLALIWLIVDRVRSGEWRMPIKRKRARQVAVDAAEEEWTPDFAPARAWLDEADALAARGLYAEAVHHLLFRSVEDIQRRRPRVVRPSLTSRELAAATGIPTIARELFARIAGYVESSLFGGRACRRRRLVEGARGLCRFRAAGAVEGMSDVAINRAGPGQSGELFRLRTVIILVSRSGSPAFAAMLIAHRLCSRHHAQG